MARFTMLAWLFFLLLLGLFSYQVNAGTLEKHYTFGIVPQQSASELVRRWTPLLRYVQRAYGITLTFETAPDIPEFERRLARGEYDFAYMNPYHYTIFSQKPGYKAFARQENKRLTGILVVRKDSVLNTLTDLRGADIAFPAPAAFAATVIPRAVMARKGVEHKAFFVRSHDSVYRNVARGFMVAGGGIERTLNTVDPEVRNQLRVLWRSDGYTPHAFAAHPRIAQDAVAKVAHALIAAKQTDEGREVLSHIDFEGVTPAKDTDWDQIRALDFRLLQHLLQPDQE